MRRYILYDLLAAIVAGLCLCGLFTACGEDRGGDLRMTTRTVVS